VLSGGSLLVEVALLAGMSLLVGARWGAFLGFVPELPVVRADFVGLQRLVGGAAAAVSGVRPVAGSGMRAAVCL